MLNGDSFLIVVRALPGAVTMSSLHRSTKLDRSRKEEERIRLAYARRCDGNLYSLFNPGHRFIIQECERKLLDLLVREGYGELEDRAVIDIGCGQGFWIQEFIKWGARPENLVGVDLLPGRIAEARRVCPAGVKLICANAADTKFGDGVFDLAIQATAFTSILDGSMRRAVAAEMLRVVKPGGIIVWYDYHINNPWNSDVRGVPKWEIRELFPGCDVALERVTLAPPITRLLAPYSQWMCSLLNLLPFLRTHYLGCIRKPYIP